MALIAPSLLAADFGNLQRDIELTNQSEADWFHIDVMDGLFVPNISFGMPVIKAIQAHAKKPLDMHLMINDPDRYLADFAKLGAAVISVHLEACNHLHRTIQVIKELGVKAGVAINPHSPVTLLQDIIQDLDLVLVMSVNPGFGGQQFIEHTYQKIAELKVLIEAAGSNALIEVDGGVTQVNAGALKEAGADVLVAGSSVYGSQDPQMAIVELKNA